LSSRADIKSTKQKLDYVRMQPKFTFYSEKLDLTYDYIFHQGLNYNLKLSSC